MPPHARIRARAGPAGPRTTGWLPTAATGAVAKGREGCRARSDRRSGLAAMRPSRRRPGRCRCRRPSRAVGEHRRASAGEKGLEVVLRHPPGQVPPLRGERGAHQADRAEPAEQRREVHRARTGRDHAGRDSVARGVRLSIRVRASRRISSSASSTASSRSTPRSRAAMAAPGWGSPSRAQAGRGDGRRDRGLVRDRPGQRLQSSRVVQLTLPRTKGARATE